MARKSYHRQFRKNGRSFMVQDLHRLDRKKPEDRYYLTMMKDNWLKIVHDPFGNMPKFATIKEAQEYAWSCGDFIEDYVW